MKVLLIVVIMTLFIACNKEFPKRFSAQTENGLKAKISLVDQRRFMYKELSGNSDYFEVGTYTLQNEQLILSTDSVGFDLCCLQAESKVRKGRLSGSRVKWGGNN